MSKNVPVPFFWVERVLIGVIVLVCAEVLSGASLGLGLWHPWTLLVTYWLYLAHFFFFTTLAVRTGRTSLSSLYLWGVLFGLYESWITKVIWHGYHGDGTLVMGSIGPYGYSEISMVFFFHPVVSFIMPLAITCVLCPPVRGLFPELARLTGTSKWARMGQAYLVLSFAPVMDMNSGGPINLALNLAAAIILVGVLLGLARPALGSGNGRGIVVFGRRGFVGLCVYLVLLYGVGYVALRPAGLPSAGVQLFTFVFYGIAIAGLRMHRRSEPSADCMAEPAKRELQRVIVLFVMVMTLALVFGTFGRPAVFDPAIVVIVASWTPLGLVLTAASVAKGARESLAPAAA